MVSVILPGCASKPDWRETAAGHGFSESWQTGRGYTHLVLDNGRVAADGRLHIYIEGDGTPWLSKTEVAADPTPRYPLMLEAKDLSGPSSGEIAEMLSHAQKVFAYAKKVID